MVLPKASKSKWQRLPPVLQALCWGLAQSTEVVVGDGAGLEGWALPSRLFPFRPLATTVQNQLLRVAVHREHL